MTNGSSTSENELNLIRNIPFNVLPKPSIGPLLMKVILEAMKTPPQENGGTEAVFNENIPAGFTYLGQFLVHDLITDRLYPTLRLEPLYGGGHEGSPKLYVRSENELPEQQWTGYQNMGTAKARSLFEDVMLRVIRKDNAYDAPREPNNIDNYGKADADMGSASNDRNFIVSQIHCAFARFHNAVVAWLAQKEPGLTSDDLFQKAQNYVTWHYQWVIVHQYLTMLVGEDLVKNLLKDDSQFRIYKPVSTPRLMPEFTKAVLRMGHSQIREIYVFPLLPGETRTMFRRNRRVRLFVSSDSNQAYKQQYDKYHQDHQAFRNGHTSTAPAAPECAQELGDMRGGINRSNLRIDWSFFFDFSKIDHNKEKPQASLAIDHKLANPIFDLFFLKERKSLPVRDLKSSHDMPTGYSIAAAYAVQYPHENFKVLTSNEVSTAMGIEGLRVEDLPFWLYILLEAEIHYNGTRMGELGGRVLAEQLIWVLKSDKKSFLRIVNEAQEPVTWNPEAAFSAWRENILPNAVSETLEAQKFCMLDLLRFPDEFFEAKPFNGPQQNNA